MYPRPKQALSALRCVVVVERGGPRAWEAACVAALRRAGVSVTVADVPTAMGHRLLEERRGAFARVRLDEPPIALSQIATRASSADFILDLAGGIKPNDVSLPRLGVWTFRRADGTDRVDALSYWRAFLSGAQTLEVALVARDGSGAARVLREGRFALLLGSRGLATAVSICAQWPAWAVQELAHSAESLCRRALWQRKERSRNAAVRGVARALKRTALAAFDLWAGDFDWNIGVVEQTGPESFLTTGDLPPVRWLNWNCKNPMYADPIVATKDERAFVFCETMDRPSTRGHIDAFAVNGSASTQTRCVLKAPFHLSYPYVFEHDGEHYLVPESAESRTVQLYRARQFPYEWLPVATLIEDFAACDSTLFRFGGRWWLFCTAQDLNPELQLFAFYADHLRGPWHPHAANPIKTDVTSARPAGTPFMYRGELYRPAQDSSDTYGGAIALNRVVRLSQTEFAEVLVRRITAHQFAPYNAGTHTFSYGGNICVIDAKRRRLSWRRLARVRSDESAVVRDYRVAALG
ncbi:MAG: hypothetical protein JO193_01285 [Candidatus Eremiobacteraeota bacterium]|nr:hypothetical protein [Candidatus Eremiobacteraeota bacterium]